MPKLTFQGPTYFSELDEAAFFSWLERIPGVTKVEGHLTTLIVTTKSAKLSDRSLRELLGLFYRYRVPMRQLAQFETPKNRHWFRMRTKYWYRKVFG